MDNLAKILYMGGKEFSRFTIALVAIEMQGDKINWDSQRRTLAGYNPAFGTIQTFESEETAKRRAITWLDIAIWRLKAAGYTLLCAPKTIDTDNHTWRRISRVKTPQGKRIALVAYVHYIDSTFDPWIY